MRICFHKYKPFANIYGDMINDLGGRTVLKCCKCNKRKIVKNYIPAKYNYNKFLYLIYLYKDKIEEIPDNLLFQVFQGDDTK